MVFMPHWPKIIGYKPIDLGLERMIKVLDKLENPQNKLPPVVHFAGTNGKGSTIAFLKSILTEAGYKVHVYTSPHLLNFNERIVINGEKISDEYLTQIIEEARIASEDTKVTFFEGTTLAAFLAFAKNPADIVLLETGMGGRLDATNVVDQPLLTVITPISIDHVEHLGPYLRTIAGEKAGILKQNTPCIVSLQEDEAFEVLESVAEKTNSPLIALGYDWNVSKQNEGMLFELRDGYKIKLPLPNLTGDHQIINSGTAIAAAKNLKGFDISDEAIINGLSKAKWPGRLQQITKGPLVSKLKDSDELWIDGAHNEAGAYILANIIKQKWKNKKICIIVGITKGREINSILKYFEFTDFLCAVKVKTEPSAYEGEKICIEAQKLDIESKPFDSVESAIDFLANFSKEPTLIVGLGSLYLSSDILKASNIRI